MAYCPKCGKKFKFDWEADTYRYDSGRALRQDDALGSIGKSRFVAHMCDCETAVAVCVETEQAWNHGAPWAKGGRRYYSHPALSNVDWLKSENMWVNVAVPMGGAA